MAFPETPTGTVWQFRINYAMNAQRLMNTFFYRQKAPVLDYRDAALQFMDNITAPNKLVAKIGAAITDQCTIDFCEMQVIADVRYAALRRVINQEGAQIGDTLPQNVAQVVTRRGWIANRRNVGALHLPPPAASQVVNGNLTDPQIAILDDVAGAVLESIEGDPGLVIFQPCLYRPLGGGFTTDLAASFPQRTVRVMTRRTVGRGI